MHERDAGLAKLDRRSLWCVGGFYLVISAMMHLVWEFAHMPLYGVWKTGSSGEIAYNGLHCTIGDVMIAAASLLTAILVTGRGRWPAERWSVVTVSAVVLSIGYTVFSEWHNVFVSKAWAYSELMPLVPGTGIGLSPFLQWLVIPTLGLWLTGRRLKDRT